MNIARNITGGGDLIVEGFNNITSSADAYGLGRVLLSGDNSAWSGDLVIAKGTASLSGNAVNAAGTGAITIGTTADAHGAGLTFFPQGANASTATYANNITVRSGGFRSIKGGNTDHNIELTGTITLDGNLNVDHALSVSGRSITLGGNITGVGGIDITRSAGSDGSSVRMTGVNDYSGATTVTSGRLFVDGSIGAASAVSVASGAALGGDGTIAGDLTFASGANFLFNTEATLAVTGSVTFDGFGIINLIGLNSETVAGSYLVLDGTGENISQTNVLNIGSGNAFDLGAGSSAYFDFTNGDLSVIVAAAIPEPGSFAFLGGLAALGFTGLRRRRSQA